AASPNTRLPPPPEPRRRRWALAVGLALAAAAAVAAGVVWRKVAALAAGPPHFTIVDARAGRVRPARFALDGRAILYNNAVAGSNTLRLSDRQSQQSRVLENAGTLLAVSNRDELAVLLDQHADRPGDLTYGTLARQPLAGGGPRAVAERVYAADFAPDGDTLAVSVNAKPRSRLEYPIGHGIYENGRYPVRGPRPGRR